MRTVQDFKPKRVDLSVDLCLNHLMATYRIQKDKRNPYVMVNKGMIYDNRLSYRAKGVLLYLLSRPDNWVVYEREIAKHAADGLWSTKMALRELVKAGYIEREKKREDKTGQFRGYNYTVYENPINSDQITEVRNTNVGESHATNNDLTKDREFDYWELQRQLDRYHQDQAMHDNMLRSIKTDSVN